MRALQPFQSAHGLPGLSCVSPPSNNCLHNHLLTLISASFPQFVLFYTSLTFLCGTPIKFSASSHCTQCVSFSAFIWHAHWHSHSLVPLPSTGECSLIIVHELYDEMPLAHPASSRQWPLTSHCLRAIQTIFAFVFNDLNVRLPFSDIHTWINLF